MDSLLFTKNPAAGSAPFRAMCTGASRENGSPDWCSPSGGTFFAKSVKQLSTGIRHTAVVVAIFLFTASCLLPVFSFSQIQLIRGDVDVDISSLSLCGSGPNLSVSHPSVLGCVYSTVQLHALSRDAGLSYLWTGPGIIGSNTGSSITVNAPGKYDVVASNTFGCTASASMTVSQNNTVPILSSSSTAVIGCNTPTAQVCVNSNQPVDITWTGPGIVGNGDGSCVTVNAPGNYTAFAVASGGCTATLSMNVVHATTPDLRAGDVPVLGCGITSAQLHALSQDAGLTYLWTGPGIMGNNTGGTITVNAPGTYVVVATNSFGCTASLAIVVTQGTAISNLSVSHPSVLGCVYSSVQLHALSTNAGLNFLWTGPGIVGSNAGGTITADAPGTYNVVATNTSGCTAAASMAVLQNNTAPVLSYSSTPVLGCNNATAQVCVNSNQAVDLTWAGPGIVGNGDGSCVTVNAPGDYTVFAVASGGCTATISINVVRAPAPTASINMPSLLPDCGSSGNLLSAAVGGSGNTLQWSVTGGGWNIVGSNNANPVVYDAGVGGSPGMFTLIVTNMSSGCSTTTNLSLACNGLAPRFNSSISDPLNGSDASIAVYPNPITSTGTIQFTHNSASSEATVELYDGRFAKVGTIFNGNVDEGVTYKLPLDAGNYPNGLYYVRITTHDDNSFSRLVIQR